MNRASRKAVAVAPAPSKKVVGPTLEKGKRTKAEKTSSSVIASNNENTENDFIDEEDNVITEEDQKAQQSLDVQYNPEIITSILADLEKHVQMKCTQMQKDADFMATSIKQAFHLELIKLPTQVKQMSLARFRSEFGDSLEAVTRGTISGMGSRNYSSITSGSASVSSSAVKSTRSSSKVFQTPSHRGGREDRMSVAQTPSSRNPREGEILLSSNGSPLGEFQTVVKAGRPAAFVPATPGLFVPLESGEIMDMDNTDIASMSQDVKQDALAKMQEMMANMQALMAKLQN